VHFHAEDVIEKVRIREKFDKLHKNLEASLDYAITLATGTDKVVKKL
jgi:hypothetical protein